MLSLKIKKEKEEAAANGGGLSSAMGGLAISRRNTNKFEDEDADSAPATPVGYSKTGNPLVDYATSVKSTRDPVEFAPQSVEDAVFSSSFGARTNAFSGGAAAVAPSPGSLKSNFLTEEVLQALPRPLSPAERERNIRQSKQTPTFELVRKVNKYKELINSPTSEGQGLRRQLLSGAVVVIVCAGYSGKRFIYERAKALGVRLVVVDGPDSWSQTLLEDGVIEKYVPLDMSNPPAVYNEALKIISEVDREVGGIDGICTFYEIAVPLVARLTEALGLPGNPSKAIECARDKYSTRKALEAAGLPTPSSFMIYSAEDLPKAAECVGFPAVIKPINGAASLGVVKVTSLADLIASYAKVLEVLRTCSVEDVHGTSQGSEPAGEDGKLVREVMMEQYLDGDEVDVDMILSDGKVTYAKVTDNLPTLEPWFNETGAVTPSLLPRRKQEELVEVSKKMLKAIGLTSGVMHVELKYTTTNGPQLIEVNSRMGGGPVRDMNLDVWGVDLVEEHLMCSVGLPSLPPIPEEPIMCIGQYSVNAARSGVVGEEIEAELERNRGLPDVIKVEPFVSAGDKVVGFEDGMPNWICDIMVKKATAEEALAYVKKLDAEFKQPIK